MLRPPNPPFARYSVQPSFVPSAVYSIETTDERRTVNIGNGGCNVAWSMEQTVVAQTRHHRLLRSSKCNTASMNGQRQIPLHIPLSEQIAIHSSTRSLVDIVSNYQNSFPSADHRTNKPLPMFVDGVALISLSCNLPILNFRASYLDSSERSGFWKGCNIRPRMVGTSPETQLFNCDPS